MSVNKKQSSFQKSCYMFVIAGQYVDKTHQYNGKKLSTDLTFFIEKIYLVKYSDVS